MDRNVSSIYVILLFQSLHYLPFSRATTKGDSVISNIFILHKMKTDKLKTLHEISTPLNSIALLADNTIATFILLSQYCKIMQQGMQRNMIVL